ncbi:MAG: response regulator [Aquabacterium sp.]|nr:response regulator [Aquabacterium sp.]
MNRVLIVDDEPAVLGALRRGLRLHFGARLQVDLQVDALQALAQARTQPYDLVISDLRMPAMDGLDFLAGFARLQPDCVRMVLTGSAGFDTAQRAINAIGVFRYLTKPWSDEALARQVQAALDQARHQRQVAASLQGQVGTPQERERRRLESLEPGITHVEWGPQGEVLMPGAGP